MPNIKSSKKDLLRSARNHARNVSVKSRLKTLRSKAVTSIDTDPNASLDTIKEALRALDSAATKGVIHKNTAARRKSRLMKRLNAATQA